MSNDADKNSITIKIIFRRSIAQKQKCFSEQHKL